MWEWRIYTLKSLIAFITAKGYFSIILYLSATSLEALLKKETCCSNPSSFFCKRTAATICSEENEKIMKSLVKSGLIRTKDFVNAYLTWSNDFLASMFHFISESCLSMFFMFLRSFTRLGINLLKKFILPINDWSSLIFLGWLIFRIASILLGSILIPSLDMIWLRSFPSSRILEFSWIPNLLVTPSSHIYPSNRPAGVNMRREATIIRFNLLGDFKEMESSEHHTQSSNIIHITFRRQVNHSDCLSLGPIVVWENLG